jgi:hypothetical protein
VVNGKGQILTQIILYQTPDGIVVATDSRAVRFSGQGDPHYFTVQKLLRLSSSTLLATAGAGYGLLLCQQFQQRVQQMRLHPAEDVLEMAIPFFQEEVKRVQRRLPAAALDAELTRLYVILAGYCPSRSECPLRFIVLASEHATDPLHAMTTGHFVCIPRRLNIEYRLNQLAVDETTCEAVEELCARFLAQLARNTAEVAPPFNFARVAADGIHLWSVSTSLLQ